MRHERTLAVAVHDIEPATFERAALIRDWLDDLGVDRVTLLVIPARDMHPLSDRRPEVATWLLDAPAGATRSPSTASATSSRAARAGRRIRATPPPANRRSSSAWTGCRRRGRWTPAGGSSSSPGSSRAASWPRPTPTRRSCASRCGPAFQWWAGAWGLHPTGTRARAHHSGHRSRLARRRTTAASASLPACCARRPRGGPHPADRPAPARPRLASHMLALEDVIRRAAAAAEPA